MTMLAPPLTQSDPAFAELAHLAALACGTPLALIAVPDKDRLMVVGVHGKVTPAWTGSAAPMAQTLHSPELVIRTGPDAAEMLPLATGEPPLCFLAGLSIRSNEGQPLGLLCVMDRQARSLSADQRAALQAVNHQIAAQLALRRHQAEYERTLQERQQAEETLRQRDEQLRQAQKMEAIGNLAGGIAHDFNNLLTVITGYSELVLKKMPEMDPQRRKLEEIKKAGDRAAALTQQLLAFSRRQILQPKVVDVNAIISGMASMLQRLVGEDVHVNIALGPGIGSVKADPGQLEQVIMNLVVNARDAMPNGGKVTIETVNVDRVPVFSNRSDGGIKRPYIMLAVSDTGSGMDEATRARIFEPYFTTKAAGKGTGLGLSTVYGIVKQSDGEILVYSEPGHGAAFKIYLPRVDHTAADLGAASPAESLPAGTETILLVEDEPGVRAFAGEALRMQGYTILEAKHGIDAQVLSKQYPASIHLLLTDVVMPQMNGREVAESLLPKRPGLKVLYMSGYAEQAVINRGIMESGFAFLQKPFTQQALVCKVREVLDAKTTVDHP
jgi:signal transduction histidine kinase/ActR/RegA family two-component response regulator